MMEIKWRKIQHISSDQVRYKNLSVIETRKAVQIWVADIHLDGRSNRACVKQKKKWREKQPKKKQRTWHCAWEGCKKGYGYMDCHAVGGYR